jgi:protein eyes shut
MSTVTTNMRLYFRCMNGGTCIDGVDNFTCSCPPRLTGTLCECLILDDETYDCDYVSPTPLPEVTESLILTTSQDIITTDVTTIYTTEYNYTKPVTTMVVDETEPWTSTTSQPKSTSVYTVIDTDSTTQEISSTTETANEETTAVTFESTTLREETMITLLTESLSVTEMAETTATTEYIDSSTKTKETTVMSLSTSTEISTTATNNFTETGLPLITEKSTEKATTEWTTTDRSTTGDTDVSLVPVTETIDNITEIAKELTPGSTTTSKVDVTSEKMFTDTPTEPFITNYPTTPFYTTTEAMEITTILDKTTFLTTTLQAECTDSFCNNHGTCSPSPNGVRVSMTNTTKNYKQFYIFQKVVKPIVL